MRPPRARLRQGLWWLAGVATVWAVAGAVVGTAWCAVAAWHLLRPPPPRLLAGISAGLLALVPVTWIVGNRDRLGEVSPALVLSNRVPGLLAAGALALLVTAVWRDVVPATSPAGGPTPAPAPTREETS